MSNTATSITTPNPTSAAWSNYLDSQSFNLTGLDGSPVTLSLADIDAFIHYLTAAIAVQGFIIGVSSLLIIILMLLTPTQKARRLIFIFNFLSLVLLCTRAILYVSNLCSQAGNGIGENFLGAIAQYPTAKFSTTIVDAFISLFLIVTIVTSLMLQVRVVFAAEPRTQKIVTAVLSLGALWIIGVYLRFTVWEIKVILKRIISIETPWTYEAFEISMIIYIGICCLLFLYKLFHAIRLRKRMGYKHFGPLQVLFVMFAQCLIIPSNIPILISY
jgi:pheromone alpha factor receptor